MINPMDVMFWMPGSEGCSVHQRYDGPDNPTEVQLQAWIDANSTGVTVTATQILENMSAYDTHITTSRAMQTWKTAMADTDAAMPRPVEDVIGTMSETQKAKLPKFTQDAYAAKVALRGEKP